MSDVRADRNARLLEAGLAISSELSLSAALQRIIELAGSPVISSMVDRLLVHVRAIRGRMIGEEDRAERSIVDHMHIIEALESRDADLAERLVRDHALNLAEDVERTSTRLD